MKEILSSDPAFPGQDYSPGVTKREYFAVMALQGILSFPGSNLGSNIEDMARTSVVVADCLIKELNKPQQ